MSVQNSDFYRQIEAVSDSLAPVDAWNPPLSGDMDCRISRDGNWWIDGKRLENTRLLRLFSTVLKREDREYFLVTPVEKWRIQVDDLPFMVVELDISNARANTQVIRARTNVGDLVTVDAEHSIGASLIAGSDNDQAIPFVHVRSGLMARFNRNTYLEVAALLQPLSAPGRYTLSSAGTVFDLDM